MKQTLDLIDVTILKYISCLRINGNVVHFLCSVSTSGHHACVSKTVVTLMNHFNLLGKQQCFEIICMSQLALPLNISGMCLV